MMLFCIADCCLERVGHKQFQMIPATQKPSINFHLLNTITQDWKPAHRYSLTVLKNVKPPDLLISPWRRYLEQDADATEHWSRLIPNTTWLLDSSPTSMFMLVSLLHASCKRGRKCRTWHDLVTTESILTFCSFKHHKWGRKTEGIHPSARWAGVLRI